MGEETGKTNCYLNKMHMMFNVPPPRLSLISPYGGKYTKYDLDMRRKAEVLKYQTQSSKSNSKLTKKQKFAQIVNSANAYTPEQNSACTSDNNTIIKKYSSSSNVPGKAVILYLDPSVPLYNFSNSISSTFSEMQDNILLPWRFHANKQTTSIPVTEVTNIATLEIMRAIVNPISKFSILIPFYTTTTSSLISKVIVKITFGGVEIAYLKPIPEPIINMINQNTNTIFIDDIILYTASGYFYEFYVGVVAEEDVTISIGTVQIAEHNYIPA